MRIPLERLPTPALLIDLARLERNLDDMARLVWAHQPVGPAKVDFAVRTGVTVALDSLAAARPLAAAASAEGRRVPYLLEIDTGLGRAGVAPGEAVRTVGELARLKGLRLRGVITHEGHLMTYAGDPGGREKAGRPAPPARRSCPA